MYIVLLGAPGAGKGTQASLLSRKLKLPHVASGDLFRDHLGRNTELGRSAKEYMDRGELVPDEVTINMVLDRLSSEECRSGCILDGFPRNVPQAEALDEALSADGRAVDRVPYIKVSEEELVRRIAGRRICRQCQRPYHVDDIPPKVEGRCDACGGELYQREDDNEETVRHRIAVYTQETAPLIAYYAASGKLVEVDGQGDADAVGERLLRVLS